MAEIAPHNLKTVILGRGNDTIMILNYYGDVAMVMLPWWCYLNVLCCEGVSLNDDLSILLELDQRRGPSLQEPPVTQICNGNKRVMLVWW